MICKGKWNKQLCKVLIILGAVSFLFGLLGFLLFKPEGQSTNTLLGMFTGFGAGIMGVAIWQLVRAKVVSQEKLEQEEIEKWDERNIAIVRAAGTAAFYAAILLMAVLIFLFMGLGYITPSYICLGGLYVLVGVFFAARKIFEKKM